MRMARTVREVMNRELFSLRPTERVEDAIGFLVALGISGAPVIDAGRPVGVVSMRDLLSAQGGVVADRMTKPAITIEADARIEAAARTCAERGIHRVIVTESDGRAIGVASTLDLLRGMLGVPATHPPTFPHLDLTTGLTWSDDAPFTLESAERAPAEAGILVLVHGGPGIPERVVWAEACDDVRARLVAMLSFTPDESDDLRRLLAHPHEIRFRAAASRSARDRKRVVHKLRELAHQPIG